MATYKVPAISQVKLNYKTNDQQYQKLKYLENIGILIIYTFAFLMLNGSDCPDDCRLIANAIKASYICVSMFKKQKET